MSNRFLVHRATVGATTAALFSIFLVCVAVLSGPHAASAAFGDTSTFLGELKSGDGEAGLNAYLDMPHGFTMNADDDFLIADTFNNVIRKWDPDTNIVTTFSGTGEYGYRDGGRVSAYWAGPKGIYDDGEALYIADTSNHKIRKITGTTVSTLPISGLALPTDVIVSGSTVFIVDASNSRIVKVTTDGLGMTELATGLDRPFKMVKNGSTLYVTEFGAGNVLTINANTGATTTLKQNLTQPRAITFANGYVYFTAGPNGVENELWRVDPDTGSATLLKRRREDDTFNSIADLIPSNGRIYMLGSGGSSIYSVDMDGEDLVHHVGKDRFCNDEGTLSTALAGRPQEVLFSPDKTKMYISYAQGNKIAVYNFTTGRLSHLAGWVRDSYTEGTGDDVRFSDVTQMAISPDGSTLYVVDRNNNRIRKLNTTTGTTTYFTGAGNINSDGSESNGYQEGGACFNEFDKGVSACAYFDRPTGIALTSDGSTLYVADAGNNRVRSVNTSNGATTLIAGSGTSSFTDGIGSAATFNGPYSLALSSDNATLYVSDKNNHAIRTITLATKTVTTLTGRGTIGYREGTFADAVLAIPENIRLGPDGALYVSEAGSLRVRRLDLDKQTTSLVSGSGDRGMVNGISTDASWDAPKGFDFRGITLYVADFRNDLIRAIDLSGRVSPLDEIASGTSFFAYDSSLRGGWHVASGDVLGSFKEEIVTGTGTGMGPQVRVFDEQGNVQASFFAYDEALRSGVRVTTCDFGGDHRAIVTVPGPGANPQVRVFDGYGNPLTTGFFALDGAFKGGAYIACGNVNGTGHDEIVIAAGHGGGAQVTVHAMDGTPIANFFAYNKDTFRGGITVATGDTDGDGRDEIITGPEYGSPHIQFFSLQPGQVKQLNPGFYAFDPDYKGGVSVATVDINGDGEKEFMIAAGINAEPHVKVYNKTGTAILDEFRPYARSVLGGTRVAAWDVDGDGRDEMLTIPRSSAGPQVRVIESEL